MQFKHTPAATASSSDDPNLVSHAGIIPLMRLAERAGLQKLAERWLSVPTDKGANAGAKIFSLVAGMVAGADSIDDLGVLRHGGLRKLFSRPYAPSTLGSFLRAFTFGHVRQLDAVASRFLTNLSGQAEGLVTATSNEFVMLDIDDSIIEVHGYQKQGSGYGYSGVRGVNMLLGTASTSQSAPVIVAQRLRKGAAHSAKGAARFIADAVTTTQKMVANTEAGVLLRADSAYYGHDGVQAARKAGAEVSVTARMNPSIRAAIARIREDAWTEIVYPNVIRDKTTGELVRGAEVAEIEYTAFASRSPKKTKTGKPKPYTGPVTGRLVVRRVKELNLKHLTQPALFDTWRYHAFFTTVTQDTLGTVAMDITHRQHAVVEQVHADLKHSALAHMPSGVFTANAAWLVCAVMAFNLTRAAGVLAGEEFTKATTGTLRRKLVNVAARVSSSARRIRLHLPEHWPWEQAWQRLFDRVHAPPQPV